MASLLRSLLFLQISIFLVTSISKAQNIDHQKYPLVFETSKDELTLQYLTKIHHTKLVLDLNGPFAWMDCDPNSGSFPGRPISRGSLQCLAAKSKPKAGDDSGSGCALPLENKIGGTRNQGNLVEHILAVDLVDSDGIKTVGKFDHNFLFACAPKPLFKGLASGAKGMLGLGRARVSLPSQISLSLASDWQFTMCLSSSNGVVLVENSNHNSYFGPQISNSLLYTPLLTGQGESQHDFFVNVKSINIGAQKLSLDIKSTKLSTIVPYTTMESSVYAIFAKAYERAALSMNMTRVEPWAPFGLCFGVEPNGPEIDLVLQSELVKWRLLARNSLVRVSEGVMCLGVLDGGLDFGYSVVLGGYQLEDMVLHFDVANSRLGFSPPLLKWQKSCSDFKLEFIPIVSM